MRVALIADIHGNCASLEAVLRDIRGAGAERIVCLGDVGSGPQPLQALARLRSLGCPVVMGNADAWLLDPRAHPPGADEDQRRIAEIDHWCAAQLRPEDQVYIRTFQPTIRVPLARGVLLCVHGSPRSYLDVITSMTPEDVLAGYLDGVRATLVAGGHTHTPMLRRVGETILINPGSVGLPYEHVGPARAVRHPPWAEYAVVGDDDGLQVEFRQVPVDREEVVRAVSASGMPHAVWWAAGWQSE